jgi:hypothetical protein
LPLLDLLRQFDTADRNGRRLKALESCALSNQDSIVDIAKAASVSIIAFQAELDYLLSDQQEHLRTYSERAFVHLQRSIAADNESKRKWTEAFDIGETACERLGSLHLLSHGMFAFKVNGEGARTDLVFPDKSVGSEAARFAPDCLVAVPESYGLELVRRSDGELKRGTVYVILDRLEDKGLVESRLEDESTAVYGVLRRLYKATGCGLRVARAYSVASAQFLNGVPENA